MSERLLYVDEMNEASIEPPIRVKVTRLAEGLNMGDGTISGQEASPEDLMLADRAIESPDIVTSIDIDDETQSQIEDDGCGDGRGVRLVTRFNRQLKRSLNRYKVFGGGLVMAASSRVGLGEARGKTLTEVFVDSIDELDDKGLDYGAHTGRVVSEKDCGCGALDRYPQALENTVIYAEAIREKLPALGINYEGLDGDFEEIIAHNADAVEANRGRDFSGRRIMGLVSKIGKVVKDLADDHLERRIVLNTIPGYTVNQELVRRATGGRVQVFATDLPRLQQIAEKLYDNPEDQRKAFLSQVIYTLGVAATLTKGDLPVYVIESESQLVAA